MEVPLWVGAVLSLSFMWWCFLPFLLLEGVLSPPSHPLTLPSFGSWCFPPSLFGMVVLSPALPVWVVLPFPSALAWCCSSPWIWVLQTSPLIFSRSAKNPARRIYP